jgi:hypothetical protein
MKKTEQNIKNIFKALKDRWPLSSTSIAEILDMTPVNAFLILKKMLSINLIEKTGKGKNTRYWLRQNTITSNTAIISDAVDHLKENDYGDDKISTYQGLQEILEKHFAYHDTSTGKLITGLDGFFAWCADPKRTITNYENQFKQLVLWISEYLASEALRVKNGFFDGTNSLEESLKLYSGSFIDRVLFHEMICIHSTFGRSRTAWEIFLWKEHHDRILLEAAIKPAIPHIRSLIESKQVDWVIYTPPTIPRSVQFADVLEELLATEKPKITVSKIQNPIAYPMAQKHITNAQERVLNAQTNVIIGDNYDWTNYTHLLILDDNFTTGSTMNAIAEKIRNQGFNGKITALSITGKFHQTVLSNDMEV